MPFRGDQLTSHALNLASPVSNGTSPVSDSTFPDALRIPTDVNGTSTQMTQMSAVDADGNDR